MINLNDSGIKATFTINQDVVRLSASHPMNVEWLAVGGAIAPHDHDYYEISFVRRGRARHQTEGGRQTLGPGSVVIVPPRGVHAFAQTQGMEVINLYYLAEWIAAGWRGQWAERGLVPLFLAQVLFRQETSARPSVLQLSAREAAAIESELEEIRDELKRENPSQLLLKASLLKVLVRLSRASDTSHEEFPEMVWSVVEEIELCVDNGRMFDLHALMRRWPITPDHGSRMFRRATGLSPQDYFQRRRIQRACALLLDAANAATRVAAELGFADAAHFSRLFRRHMGMGPRDYRRKYAVAR
ncbi:MAG: helix-turn-helix domain-containing protein [Opitutaceae bacterium]|nr:helix-turn-helix domain-containing protein [Cephaloticoccus sp.]MCP5531413.1 helix-turn-helix domain-containing protein [Opitutaceae bacterium]